MGSVYSIFSDCFKKGELENPILTIDTLYEDNKGLTKLSYLIDNKYVNWNDYESKSEQEYLRVVNETMKLRKKYRNDV